MADRRTEDTGGTRGQEELTQRVNKAYAAAPPVQPDADNERTAQLPKPSGRERLAAALARGESSAKESPASAATASPEARAGGKPSQKRIRKAQLRVTHVDPWSVMKTSFLFSVAIGIVVVVAVGVVWAVLGAAGIWDSIDATVADVVGETGEEFRIENYLGTSRVMGFTMIVAAVDVVLVTVIGTLAAFLYNLAAALLGGIEVVLAEDER